MVNIAREDPNPGAATVHTRRIAPEDAPPHRNHAIDAFRGLAILSVMAFHYTIKWPSLSLVHLTYPGVLGVGAYGVEVFFVISGLVIAMTVTRSGSASEFMKRRFARLWPAMLVASSLTFALTHLGPKELRVEWGDWLASLTFLADDLGRTYVDGAYWSLAVEVKFYAVVALAWLALRERFWMGVLAVALLSAALHRYRLLVDAQLWSYFLVGMGAWYGFFAKQRAPAAVVLTAGLGLFCLSHPAPAASAFIVVCVAALFAAIRWPIPLGPLPALGRASYSIYLVHQYLGIMLLRTLSPLPDFVSLPMTGAAMIALGTGLYLAVELPGQRLILSRLRRPLGKAPGAG